jgi:hypothetical protein
MNNLVISLLNNSYLPLILMIIGGVLGLLGAITTAYQQNAFQDQLSALSRKNAELSENNTKLTEQALTAVTGGDSYCTVEFFPYEAHNIFNVLIHNKGEYPLYDIRVQLIDADALEQPLVNTLGESEKRGETFNVGTIPANRTRYLTDIEIKGTDRKRYGIRIWARNGYFGTSLHLKRLNGHWYRAWITKGFYATDQPLSDQRIFERKADGGYPKDEKGEPIWNSIPPHHQRILEEMNKPKNVRRITLEEAKEDERKALEDIKARTPVDF